ncbi:uncharacterized protein Z518_02057 [Rhinocladiella mackenziei CBS 650.93]|uniref:Uncharacterized protein n=1 Tax=Rhinocladiella mackenziei CBS 650.93 TaxID=1442369 RepID=A0A0D2INL2_9EURO|nr:uncharacterized protein Z518_02057 [Rhinocladiella mackenziei CBS 650.93]KIX07404.1 hypothetical protein Z518_02057 [Rhinocladiella mackenziei CBS 650.93]
MGLDQNTFRVNRPINQNAVCGLILFCLPGIYTALTGLGAGGGKASSGTVANQTNAILYGLFALFACLGGTIVNLLRPRLSMFIGSFGYPLYVGAMWYYDRTGHPWFPLFAGAVLGTLCGILTTCCGMIAISYSEEKEKGLFIAMQWAIRAVGATTAAAISLGINIDKTTTSGVADSVYIAFVVIQCSSLLLSAFLIVDTRKVKRDNGTHLAIVKQPTLMHEIKALARCFADKRLLLLVPASLGYEMALALVSTINGFYFNLRTRSLNNFSFQVIQLLGPILMILGFDGKHIQSRKTRGLLGVAITGSIAVGACTGLYGWLDVVNWSSLTEAPRTDWSNQHYGGFFVIYLLYGLIYSCFQMAAEWIIASLSNDPSVLAQYAGFFRGLASLGMCLSFILAAQKVPQYGQVTFQLILYILGIMGMVCVLVFYVTQSNYFREDNTIAPHNVEQDAFVRGKLTQEQLEQEYQKEKIAAGQGTRRDHRRGYHRAHSGSEGVRILLDMAMRKIRCFGDGDLWVTGEKDGEVKEMAGVPGSWII